MPKSPSNAEVTRVLRKSGLLQQFGENSIFPAEANYTMATRKALLRAKELLAGTKADVRVFYEKEHLPVDPAPPATGPAIS